MKINFSYFFKKHTGEVEQLQCGILTHLLRKYSLKFTKKLENKLQTKINCIYALKIIWANIVKSLQKRNN